MQYFKSDPEDKSLKQVCFCSLKRSLGRSEGSLGRQKFCKILHFARRWLEQIFKFLFANRASMHHEQQFRKKLVNQLMKLLKDKTCIQPYDTFMKGRNVTISFGDRRIKHHDIRVDPSDMIRTSRHRVHCPDSLVIGDQ